MNEFLLGIGFGFLAGVGAVIGLINFLGKREIAKRQKRNKTWQEKKKQIDREFREEMDIR
jgi:hypothetical protein